MATAASKNPIQEKTVPPAEEESRQAVIVGHCDTLPPVTVALLGASNLSRGYWALSRCLRKNLVPRRVRILTALGPGRGYVAPGGLWHLQYPPIKDSPVFSVLEKGHRRGESTLAFLTDLGNDFLYNVTGEELIAVLDALFTRLEASHTKILVTPIHPILTEILTPKVYEMLRTWLYPKSRVPYEQVIDGIHAVNYFLKEAESAGRIELVTGLDAYLGWDYVHYGWVRATAAWSLAAEAVLSHAGQTLQHSITVDSMLGSYFENGVRLAGTDMLGWFPRRTGFY